MKKVVIAFIAGVLFATAGTAAATSVIERVTASVRTDYSVKLDGQKVELQNAPLAYKGSAYIAIKEVGQLIGKEVGFDSGVINIDTPEIVEHDKSEDATLPSTTPIYPNELQKTKDEYAAISNKNILLKLELERVVYLPENEQQAAKVKLESQIKEYDDALKVLEEKLKELES